MKATKCSIVAHRLGERFRGNALFSLLTLLLFCPASTSATKNKFILGVECQSGNIWSEGFLGIPTRFINAIILDFQGYNIEEMDRAPGSSITYRYNRIKVNGQKMDYQGHKTFGFKGVDLFRDFEYSLKFGWQPQQIPVGFYARIGYRHENFDTRQSEADEWTKHRINCLRPGIGIRISPFENLLGRKYWENKFCPIIEIGSTYDYYLSYKGNFGSDKEQLSNGVSLCVGLGMKLKSGTAILLTLDRQNYDLFNKDFTVNGLKPYEKTETNHFNISLSLSLGL